MKKLILFVPLAMLFTGCAAVKDIDLSKQEVSRVHEMIDAGNYDAIYEAADEAFRTSVEPARSRALFERVHTAMGAIQSADAGGFEINTKNGSTFVKLTYTTSCAKGKLKEEFDFRMRGKQPKLLNYSVEQL